MPKNNNNDKDYSDDDDIIMTRSRKRKLEGLSDDDDNKVQKKKIKKTKSPSPVLDHLPPTNHFKDYLASLDQTHNLPENIEIDIHDPNFNPKLDVWNQNDSSDDEYQSDEEDSFEDSEPTTSDEDFIEEDELDTIDRGDIRNMIISSLTKGFRDAISEKMGGNGDPMETDGEIHLEKGEPPAKRRRLNDIDTKYLQLLRPPNQAGPMAYFQNLSNQEKEFLVKTEERIRSKSHFNVPDRIRVMNSSLSDEAKSEIIHRIDQSNCSLGDEGVKIKEWVNNILEIPFGSYQPLNISKDDPLEKIQDFMNQTYHHLDKAVYGHAETKCHLLQIIGKWITNPSSLGNCLALQGPPGVGKTTIIKEGLSKIFGRPFHFLSLGGAKDSSLLEGHGFTYLGSIPGQIVRILQQSNCMNPIIYFDELDKISKETKGDEISNLLVHLIDTQQNDKFHDKYIGNIDIDLSKVFWVFSFNNEENINPILKDRIQVVNINGYNTDEKVHIAQKHLIPHILKDVGFQPNEIILSDEVVKYIITNHSTSEEGVRNLKRSIDILVTRINIVRLTQKRKLDSMSEDPDNYYNKLPFKMSKLPYLSFPLEVTKSLVDTLLVHPKKNEPWKMMYS